MIFHPTGEKFLWDTWLFPWKGEFHLFFLQARAPHPCYEYFEIGHAVSKDLVHWEEMPAIDVSPGPQGNWDQMPTLTGMVVRHDDAFWMFYGARLGDVARIGVMLSQDLIKWKPFEGNPVLVSREPYYQEKRDEYGNGVGWRDPCITWRDDWQAYEALICADKPKWNEQNTGACIGRCHSKDLIHWELLPPAMDLGSHFLAGEVPDYFELNGRHYLLFSSQSGFGRRLDTASRTRTTGTYYAIAEQRDGEYKLPADYLLIGASLDRKDNYVARSIDSQGRRLLYHQMYGYRPTWGTPKLINTTANGELFLEYWQGLEALEKGVQLKGFGNELKQCKREVGTGKWELKDGKLSGRSIVRSTSAYLDCQVTDCHITCDVLLSEQARLGIILRHDESVVDEAKRGVIFSLDAGAGAVEWGSLSYSDVICLADEIKYQVPVDKSVQVRILARNEYIDLYLDDRWIFSACAEGLPRKGGLEFSLEGGTAEISNMLVSKIEPLREG